jgi:AcrR family transcriptional regulator
VAKGGQGKSTSTRGAGRSRGATSSRSKRTEIITTAIEHFGNRGYEYTKWADIAADVGLGSTALYHYFESKLHCLYEVHAEALDAEYDRFNRLTSNRGEFGPTLVELLLALFDLTDHEVLRNRVLVAEEGLLAIPRSSPREEDARRRARARMRDIEFAWAAFLTRGMEQGAIAETDPRLLTRAVLGLYNSVWHWYRPGGSLSLEEVRDFFVERCLAVASHGAAAPLPATSTPASKPRADRRAA